ncbi:hypothetical protein SAMN05192551_1217 [Tindallia magadiensis]|uniref:Restriction endonuclease n=1 Tax=Tindallia magadiensis TaxID=69895 RepID=A0A1I3I408_9FIRM|nr:hypothetical protein [Tindallia magadiensis]SFI42706.1 hypothetical protein SAMN05192551_1217 [Tindallia magadiensis]
MNISEIFKLDVSQQELDFIDIDLEIDYPLFIDPFLISNQKNNWVMEADLLIKNFFNEFKINIIERKYEYAVEMLSFMSEPKETCLGLSKSGTMHGRGVGIINSTSIVDKIVSTKAIQKGIVNNIEDLMIFVDDIDKDKISDMVTNIIRGKLIEYTQQQCNLWGIKLTKGETLPFWDAVDKEWIYTDSEILIVNGREIILVPKFIVSPISVFTAQSYNWFFIVEQERNFHLQRRSSIVKMKKLKNGTEKYTLSKKDTQEFIKEHDIKENSSYKSYIRDYTLRYPELFEEFVKYSKRVSKPISNDEIIKFCDSQNQSDLIDYLIEKLENIPTGRNDATRYHHLVKSLLEVIFYPELINPIIEREIHDGRKRIDIVMDNNANKGFFEKLNSVSKIFSPYIYIECKNYETDIKNPELDQLAGRFSDKRGRFGLLLCRNISDVNTFKARCKDTYNDGRGLIIGLTDNDIVRMLEYVKDDNRLGIDKILEDNKRDIMI